MGETEGQLLLTLVREGGIPGAMFALLGWAIWRFGFWPTAMKSGKAPEMATAIALEKLSGKVDDLATEMGDQFELRREAAHAFELAVVQRLSALESNVKSLERERK